MSNLNSGKGKFNKFIMGKGFYFALAVCLVGAGAAAWVSVDKTINSLQTSPLEETPPAQTQQAEQKMENVVKTPEVKTPEVQTPPSTPNDSASTQTPPQTEPNPAPAAQAEATTDQPVPEPTSSVEVPDSSKEVSQPSASSSVSEEPSEPVAQSEQQELPQNVPTSSFVLPVNGQMLNEFSGENLVKNVTLNDWRTHNGVDLKAEIGTEVNASESGTVTKISTDPLWGNVLEVTSANHVVLYCGLADDIPVKVDDMISVGQIVGKIGTIPCESALEAHLHLEVKENGKYVDPMSLVAE